MHTNRVSLTTDAVHVAFNHVPIQMPAVLDTIVSTNTGQAGETRKRWVLLPV